MDRDDPFSMDDNDRTVILPNPGGRVRKPMDPPLNQPLSQQPPVAASHNYQPSPAPTPGARLSAVTYRQNPLVGAGHSLLILGYELSNSLNQDGIDGLRERIVNQIKQYEQVTRQSGYGQSECLAGRFLLCAYLDESVLTTPWGSNSSWSSQTLVSLFHQQRGSGEKFFQVVANLLQDPVNNLHLLELASLCIAFGFKGKYRMTEKGAVELLAIESQINQAIMQNRAPVGRRLSPDQHVVLDRQNPLTRYVPLWVIAAVGCLLLMIVYGGFTLLLNQSTKPVVQQVEALQLQISPASINAGKP